MFCMKDSRGNKSKTLFFVAVSWGVLVIKYALAGLSLALVGTIPPMSAGEFGAAVMMILGIWLGREVSDRMVKASAKEDV
jgi:hypothetical protein